MSDMRSTKDYNIFRKKEANRALLPVNLKRLVSSIRAQNLLKYRPIIVDKNYFVIDGQHRLEAAKILGVEIFYQIHKEATDEDMVLLNNSQAKWELADYVNYYLHKGHPEYLKYKEFADKIGLSIVHMIKRVVFIGGKQYQDVKSGKLKFLDPDQMMRFEDSQNKYEEFLKHIKKYILGDNKFIDSGRFEKAIRMIIKNEEIDWKIFLNKTMIKSDAIKLCPTAESYYHLLLDIYNWKNREKVHRSVPSTQDPQKLQDNPDQFSMG